MAFYNFASWSAKGNTWYIRENTVDANYLGIGAAAGEEDNTSLWWNDYGGNGTSVGNWRLNGDDGSVWDIMPVPSEEIPTGITVITWNLKRGDKVITTVKSAAVQGVTYPAPFDAMVSEGGSAIAGTEDQTVDITYKENLPFASSETANNAIWYKAIMRGNKYLHYDNPEVSCNTGNSSKNDIGSYFAFVGDAINGFKIYNAALTGGNALGGNLGNRLTAVPEADAPAFMLENNSGHNVFRNPESPIGYLNDNNSYLAYWLSSWGATDGGSTWTFEAVDDELNAKINTAGTITYKIFKDGKVVATESTRALGGDPYPTVPVVLPGYYSDAPNGVVNGDASFNITLKPALPISKDYASATWFRLINRPGTGDRYLCYQEGLDKYELTEKAEKNDAYLWAIVGTPEEGFKIMNKAAGDGKYLSVNPGNGNCPTMTETPQVWEFKLQSGGSNTIFGLGVNGFWLNDYANNHFLSLWQSGPDGDAGSTLKIEEVNIIDGMYADADGAIEIATAEELKAFAELVNGENPYANAILVADIDKGTENYRIGRDGQDFQGVFDGNGHTITYDMTFTENGAGLFRNVGVHAVIQNLKVQGTITTNSSFAGSIAGWNSGRIRGCYADVTINSSKSGDATDGGLVGIAYRGTVIENCLAKVKILGENTTNCGGIVGWANDKINIVNCLVVNDGSTFKYDDSSNGHSSNISRNEGNLNVVNLDNYNANPYANRPAGANYNNYVTNNWGTCNATTVVPYDELADGKICYQLNNDQSKVNWVQQIGTDAFPVPAAFGSGQVYASAATGCNGKADGLTYSNTPSNVAITPHTFDKYGICTTCGCFNFDGFEYDKKDAAVLFKSADDIFLAEGWNRVGDGFKLNMKMVNDITITSEPGQYIFNTSNWVDGNFNGDGHVLTIEITEVGEKASFIPEMTGNFENVIMHGKITTSGQRAASISGNARMALVRNVYSDITINTSKTGDNTSGGFFGVGYNNKKVENCIYAGDIIGVEGTQCIAGICGWAEGNTNLTNCAFLGTLNNAGGDSHTISRQPSKVSCKNVFSLNEYNNTDAGLYTKITPEAVASGELAFLLNESKNGGENFYQIIGSDPMPMPFANAGATVYAIADSYNCDGTPQGNIQFANEEYIPVLPDHVFEDGVCVNCECLDTDEDGYNKITSAKSLARFSALVNKGNGDMKVRMYDDIDMLGVDYAPAGNTGNLFVGEFDGQNHVISNLTINGGDYTGLIGVIGGGADIKNFTLDNTCNIRGNAFCGIVGGTNGGGNVYLTNLGNEGNVTGTAQNVCGILGVDMGGSATLYIKNCYVTGAIKGDRESATICGWSNGSSVVENCYSIASLEGIYGDGSFTRGGTAIKNCYEIESVGQQPNVNKITDEEVANGALCYKLGGAFGQILGVDEYPNLASITSASEVLYDENLGYYNPLPAKIMDCQFENVVTNDIVKSADINGEITLTIDADDVTGNAVALIMDAAEYAEKGIIAGKHLFGAVGKNGGITVEDGKVIVKFTSFSTHTDQPIFEGDLERKDVGDVKAEAKYVVIIYGGSLVIEGEVWPENIVEAYDGSSVISLTIDQAVRVLNAEEDPTAIDGINANEDAEIISITGVRVNKAQKGVYIINGKKTAVK
jgi:hypothetical protein